MVSRQEKYFYYEQAVRCKMLFCFFQGSAVFSDLVITHAGQGYILQFSVSFILAWSKCVDGGKFSTTRSKTFGTRRPGP